MVLLLDKCKAYTAITASTEDQKFGYASNFSQLLVFRMSVKLSRRSSLHLLGILIVNLDVCSLIDQIRETHVEITQVYDLYSADTGLHLLFAKVIYARSVRLYEMV